MNSPRELFPRRIVSQPTLIAGFCLALAAAVATVVSERASGATAAAEQPAEPEHAVPAPLAWRSLLLDGVAIDGRMVAVGERGHILLSTDHGTTWHQAEVPTRATLTAVCFHDETHGWVVGHDAVILRTRDGGESWELVHHAPEEERPFLDVWFRNAQEGFAIGAYIFFLKTADGGTTWSEFTITSDEEEVVEDDAFSWEDDDLVGGDFHLNHIARSAAGRLYIAAEAGTVYRSDDDGESWTILPSPYEGSFFGTLPLEGDALLLFGLRGHLFRSEDAGESWQELETAAEEMLTDGRVLQNGEVVIVGLGGTLLRSRDGGRSFTLEQQVERQAIATVLEAGDGGLILIGESGIRKPSARAEAADATR